MATYNDWLTMSPTTGTGNTTATVTISSHSGYATRAKDVKVSATINGEKYTETVTFKQTGSNTTGNGAFIIGTGAYTGTSIAGSSIGSRSISFALTGTNAKFFEYYVIHTGSLKPDDATRILAAPTINTTVTSVVDGSAVTFNSLTPTTTTFTGGTTGFKTIYSLPRAQQNNGLGEHQTYSVQLYMNVPNTFSNTESKGVSVQYGVNAIFLTGVNMTETTTIPVKSLSITYPASTAFSVTGGTGVGSRGGTHTIGIELPSDVTWTAEVVDPTA